MKIKKLSKEELTEGLTMEMVNAMNMAKNFTPIQLKQGDEPCNIIPCTGGFWVMIDGKALRGADNKYIIFPERDCQVGRVRYLLNFGKAEKEKKIQALIIQWKKEVRDKIDIAKKKIAYWGPPTAGSLSSILMDAIRENGDEEEVDFYDLQNKMNLDKFLPIYQEYERLWDENKIVELMDHFKIGGIKLALGTPMLSAQKDNAQDMKVMINTFGKTALDEWDGDMLYKYAQIEIEKEYPV